ncbi:Ig-like domain-containing protein [Methanomethylovorans sp.]|uniref:Ig-like domain-containing protein n=1 Tax=Methanomethylovorans sp. TaxID=2758717 RepID=UPI00351C2DDA
MNKKIFLLLNIILLFLIVPLAGGDGNGTYEHDNTNMILLKAGAINTDTALVAADKGTDEVPLTSVASYSVNTADTNENTERYYIVQFTGPVLEEWKDGVAESGAALFDYVPNNAFIVRMNLSQKEQVESLDVVQWTGEYKASYKHQLDTEDDANPTFDGDYADIIILLFDGNESQRIKEEVLSIDADIVESSDSVLKVMIAKDRIEDLAAIQGVSWMEEYEEPVLLNDVAAGIINVNEVRTNYNLKGSGQIVAVCDSGLDTGVNDNTMHADIRGRIVSIIDLVGDGAEDQHGHGTFVAGSVLGNGALSEGKYSGMAPEALLVFQAAATDEGNFRGVPVVGIPNIFHQAYDYGARIHTNSWGYFSLTGDYNMYSQQVDQFMWEHPDMLTLFSAGNEGQLGIIPPGTAKNTLTVGASENYRPSVSAYSNNINEIAYFSSRGPTDDGRIKPDLVAPGTYIITTRSSISSNPSWGIVSRDYIYGAGTSASTPLVAGTAALVRQYYNEIEGLSNPSAALMKATLINGAYDITSGTSGRPDFSQGWGRVDLENSLFPEYPEVIAYYDNKAGIGISESWGADCDYIKAGSPLRATLVWTDYPGTPYSSVNLVNNLDLTVAGTETTYYGNGAPDSINNVEAVEIKSIPAGDYRFSVTGKNVPYGPQPFALVLSFTCDNNVFPASGSYAENSKTRVSTDVVHPVGVKPDSIKMTINNNPVSVVPMAITDGYRIQYDTLSSYQSGICNVSVTALANNGQAISYQWEFNVKPAISSFRLEAFDPVVVGKINEASKTVTLTVPNGTDVKEMVPSIEHTGSSISPDSATVQDFTKPVTYTLRSADGTAESYTVTVNVAPVSVISITLAGEGAVTAVEAGKTLQMNATVLPTNAADRNVMWSVVAGTGNATISQTGLLTGIKPGTVTVRATASDGFGVEGSLVVTVTAIQVTGISISGAEDTTEVDNGKTLQMVATVYPANATFKDVTWSVVAGTGTATISQTGLLTGTKPGTTTVKATANDGSGVEGSLLITVVEVPVPVTSITIAGEGATTAVENGKTLQMTATVLPTTATSKDVIWSVIAGTGDATISQTGLLTGTKVGTVTVIAMAKDGSGVEGSSVVTITAATVPVTSITVTGAGSATTVENGKTLQMTATVNPATATKKDVTWSVVDGTGTATINQNGLLIGTKAGALAVKATANDGSGVEGSLLIAVIEVTVPVTSITIAGEGAATTVENGETLQMTATVMPTTATNKDVTWSVVAGTGTATISTTGLLTGTKAGTTTVKATASDGSGVGGTLLITVVEVPVPVTAITIAGQGGVTVVENGKTLQMTATVMPATATNKDVTWSVVAGTGTATITQTGLLTGNKSGTVTIKAMAKDGSGVEGSSVITVNEIQIPEIEIPVTGIALSGAPTTVESEKTLQMIATIYPANATFKEVSWSVENITGAAVISQTGLLTGKATGNVTVRVASAFNSSVKDALNITVTAVKPISTSGGGGSGGGSGSTGENIQNIVLKDVSSIFVGKGSTRFNLSNPDNSIQYIEYTSLKNTGTITATVEVLKEKSTFADSSPKGVIYKHINIWLGKTGYATEENLMGSVIGFRVDKNWIDDNSIDPASVALNRYSDDSWSRLSTKQTGTDENYLYYQAQTSGFSPFAITGERLQNEKALLSTPDNEINKQESFVGLSENETQAEKTLPSLPFFVTLLIVSFACFLKRKQ